MTLNPKQFEKVGPEGLKIRNEDGEYLTIRSQTLDESRVIEDVLYFVGYKRTDYKGLNKTYKKEIIESEGG